MSADKLRNLLQEANELSSIFVTSLRTAKGISSWTAPSAYQLWAELEDGGSRSNRIFILHSDFFLLHSL
jgi:hypothetical protein